MGNQYKIFFFSYTGINSVSTIWNCIMPLREETNLQAFTPNSYCCCFYYPMLHPRLNPSLHFSTNVIIVKVMSTSPNVDLAPVTVEKKTMNTEEPVEPPTELPVSELSGWRMLAVSAGFLTTISILGVALLLDTEAHSPLVNTIRAHTWLPSWDDRLLRPIRSAFLGFWHR